MCGLLDHSLTHPLPHPLPHSPTHSPTHSLTHPPTHPLTHSPTPSLTHSPTPSQPPRPPGSMASAYTRQAAPTSKMVGVYVTHVHTPSCLCVQLIGETTTRTLEFLLEDLSQFYNSHKGDAYMIKKPHIGQVSSHMSVGDVSSYVPHSVYSHTPFHVFSYPIPYILIPNPMYFHTPFRVLSRARGCRSVASNCNYILPSELYTYTCSWSVVVSILSPLSRVVPCSTTMATGTELR